MNSSLKKLAYGVLYELKGRRSKVDSLYDMDNIESAGSAELQKILTKHNAQSSAIAFLDKDGNHCYASAGYNFNGNKINRYTLFRLASISKLFLALIALRLHERGRIDIYSDVSEYLGHKFINPNFPNESITLFMLLTHISSLVDGTKYYSSFENNPPYNEVIEFADYKPGSSFSYSNFGYGIIGIALEKALGKSIDVLLQEEICDLIAIKACYFPSLDEDVAASMRILNKSNIANYCLNDELYNKNEMYRTLPVERRYLKAAGGVHSNSDSLLKFAKILLADNKGENKLLSKSSIELLQTISSAYRDSVIKMYYGVGMQIIDDKRVCKNTLYGHEGFAYGSVNMMFYDKAKDIAIIQLNGGAREWCNGKLACFNQDIIKWYYKYY